MPPVRRQKLLSVPVKFSDGLTLNLVIDRGKTTGAWRDALIREDGTEQEACDILAEVIDSWDVTDEAGVPIPANGQALFENFDVEDTEALGLAILEAVTPSRAEGNASSPSSAATTPAVESSAPLSPTSQNGSETSPSPSVSASPSPS